MSRFTLLSILLLISSLGLVEVPAEEGSQEDREKWESLTQEEREKLREALREVWTDPAVLSAREEVKLASEAYQEAIRTAVGKAYPSVTGLLEAMQSVNEGNMRARVKGEGPGRFGPRGLEYSAGPPAFLEKLTPEERELFKEAEQNAQNAESVVAARKEMEALRERDEQIRRQRMEAHLKMRKALLEVMFEENPELKSLQSRLGFTPGKGKATGKGKGRPASGKKSDERSKSKEE
ncbi:MAG: hypothetical protein AAF491_03740 [Verrucomicrobiota bacterium]